MKILMLSSSRAGDEAFLHSAKPMIRQHLGERKNVLFVPYAGVTMNWDDYTAKVADALPHLNVTGMHTVLDAQQAIKQNDAILVGGGNTFNLLHTLYETGQLALIRDAVKADLPYIGWSAGSNICGLTIRTTNDMPIVQPQSFDALQLVPFQLNPHYTDYQPPGFNGETRDQRLAEFCTLNPDMPVLAIREGTALQLVDSELTLLGIEAGKVFLGKQIRAIEPKQDLSDYLNQSA